MNILTLVISLVFVFNVFANQPDFICYEESGFNYEFYYSEFTEIHQFDESNVFIDQYDGIEMIYKTLESYPSFDQFTFRYADGQNVVAVVKFKEGSDVGEGSMIDNDQTMACLR
ncbi:MAG: hypothetical protein ISR65_01465 [Bacteriovoracaceae bacterium]|nr:hypothetical protein [Bacteriovoracaceae bacterium]